MIRISHLTTLVFTALVGCFSTNAMAGTDAKLHKLNPPKASTADAQLSFWDLPNLKKAYINTSPTKLKNSLPTGTLSIGQSEREMVIKVAKEIAKGSYGDYDSMLISHKGELVFESYYRKGRVNLLHFQASATKALTSLILGRAIQLGYLSIDDLNKPIVSFLSDLDSSKFTKGANKITLHKALTMHGGLDIKEEFRKELETPADKLKGQGFVQALLEHSAPITESSQIYKYGNYNPILVMQVIDAVVPGTAENFIKKELLDKLGIQDYQWKKSVSGQPEAGWRVSMTSRDMLKWGELMLNDGKWQGEQLLSKAYLERAKRKLTKPTEDWMPKTYSYGYFIYQSDIPVANNTVNTNFAWGGGGQYIITSDELDLNIVITGHDRDDKIMPLISKFVIPAFASDSNEKITASKDL